MGFERTVDVLIIHTATLPQRQYQSLLIQSKLASLTIQSEPQLIATF